MPAAAIASKVGAVITIRGSRPFARNGRQPPRSTLISSLRPVDARADAVLLARRGLDLDLVARSLDELDVHVAVGVDLGERRRASGSRSATGPSSAESADDAKIFWTTSQASTAATIAQATTRIGRAERRMAGPPELGPPLDAPSRGVGFASDPFSAQADPPVS